MAESKNFELDQEDKNFLEDLIEELRKHDGIYDSEADELEHIVLKLEGNTK